MDPIHVLALLLWAVGAAWVVYAVYRILLWDPDDPRWDLLETEDDP